jgi:MFS family permease
MKGNDYSWVASALYFGWLIGAYPWNIVLQRYPIGKLLGCMLFVWGAVCMLQAAVFNFAGFFAIRFFLGMLEACISPAFVILTSMLWTREEQALRTSFWLSTNGISSILGALLAYGSGHADNLAVSNWKLIYLVCIISLQSLCPEKILGVGLDWR